MDTQCINLTVGVYTASYTKAGDRVVSIINLKVYFPEAANQNLYLAFLNFIILVNYSAQYAQI